MKRKVSVAIISAICLIFLVFVSYNHLWRIGGFKSCVNPDDNSIFYAIMNKYSSSKFKDESKYLIFDAEKSTMWICWYEGA